MVATPVKHNKVLYNKAYFTIVVTSSQGQIGSIDSTTTVLCLTQDTAAMKAYLLLLVVFLGTTTGTHSS